MAIKFVPKAPQAAPVQSIAEEEPLTLNLGYSASPTKSSKHVPEEHVTPSKPTKRTPAKKHIRTQPLRGNKPPIVYSESALNEILEVGGVPKEDAPPSSTIDPTTNKRVRGTRESVDFRRKQVLRLVLRGVPKGTIAEHLGVSVSMVYEDVQEMTKEMRAELRSFDYPGYIGMTLAFYDECRNIALRLATDTSEKSNGTKMQALRTAIVAEDSKHNFLTKVGLHKVTSPTDPFNSIQSGRSGSYSDENDINSFLQSIATLSNSNIVDVAPKHADTSAQY